MSNVQIPNLPSASALAGTELFEGVQAGSSVKVTANQIATFALSGYTSSTVASFSGGSTGLTPATATTGAVVLGGVLGVASGGTGQMTASASFNALSPITSVGDLIIGNGSNSGTRLAIGANGQILTSNGTTAVWTNPSSASVSSVNVSGGSTGLTTSGGPITTSGTITIAGTLALASGGTGQTTKAAAYNALTPITSVGDLVVGNGANSATRLAIGTNGQILTSNGTTATWAAPVATVSSVQVSGGTTGITFSGGPITSSGTITMAGTLAIANGGTGQTTASAAFNALSPITSVGDVIIGNGVNSATRLAIGANGTVLSSNGTTAVWSAAGAGSVTSVAVSGGTTGLTTSGGPITSTGTITLAGTLAIANGGTGQTTAGASFNALSPITSTGDLIIGNGVNSATRLGIGTNGQILTSNGTTATWQTVSGTGTVTSVSGSGGTTGLTLTGGPITAAGTLTLGGTLAIANGGTGATSAAAALTALGGIGPATTDTLTNKTLTSPTINGGALSGTFSGAVTRTGLETISRGLSTGTEEYLQFRPTDFGTGKPYLTIQKPGVGTQWNIALWDGTNTAGTINIAAGTFTWNGNVVADTSSAQTFTALKTTSRGTAVTGLDYAAWVPTDQAVGKPGLYINKSTTASQWNINLYDTVNSAGTINFNSATGLTWNGSQLIDAGTTQTITGAKTFSGIFQVTTSGQVEIGRVDGIASTPFIDFHSGATVVDYDSRIIASGGTGAAGGGTITFDAASVVWSGSQILNAGSAQTLTGLKTISRGTSTTVTDYLQFVPTDFGTGKPGLYVTKSATAATWQIGLYDGTNNAGTINFASTTGLTWGGVQLATISTAQTLTNKTLTDSSTYFADNSDASKTFQFELSSISTATTRTWTVPNVNDTFVGLTATQTLTNKTLTSPAITTPTITGTKETRVTMGANDIDLSAGNYFAKTISGTTTLTVSNVPATGTAISFILDLTNGGSAAITWWSGVKWPSGTAPTLTSAGRDVLGFFTYDGGTTWTGLLLGKDVK